MRRLFSSRTPSFALEWHGHGFRDALLFENELKGSTDWYWSIPPVALAEVEKAGLSVVSYAGAESFLGGMAVMLQNMLEKEKTRYEKVLQVAATMAELPQYRDSTDHLVVVAKNG